MEEPVMTLIRRRFSCRRYDGRPIEAEKCQALQDFLAASPAAPFGATVRLGLAAASAEDSRALKGLGTYGLIRGVADYLIGAVKRGPRDMEDFGYLMELAILRATGLGLGTCWLGGMFTKSSFARKIAATGEETVPAVTAVGYGKTADGSEDGLRRFAGGHRRLPPEELFFDGRFGRPLAAGQAGVYGEPLEAVRLAPSASNKQPWRLIHQGDSWHFYLQRTKGYGKGSLIYRLLGLADLQRVDMGIAMCHFELAAREAGLAGCWLAAEPDIAKPGEGCEYIVSWHCQ